MRTTHGREEGGICKLKLPAKEACSFARPLHTTREGLLTRENWETMDGWKAVANDAGAFAAGGAGADTHHRAAAPPSSTQGLLFSPQRAGMPLQYNDYISFIGSVFMFQRRRVPINWRHLG